MAVAADGGPAAGPVPRGSRGIVGTAPDPEIVTRLRREARKPLDLSDLPDGEGLDGVRAEVSRLRVLLRDAAMDDSLILVSLRPTQFCGMGLPIPAADELRDMLAAQSQAKEVMIAREHARSRRAR